MPEPLQACFIDTLSQFQACMMRYDLRAALYSVYDLLEVLNKHIDDTKPWTLKTPDTQAELSVILSRIGCGLRMAGILLYPFFTGKMTELLTRIGCVDDIASLDKGELIQLIESFNHLEEHSAQLFTIKEK